MTTEQSDQVDIELERLGVLVGFPQATKFKAVGKEKGRESFDLFLNNSGGYMKNWLFGFMNDRSYDSYTDEEKIKAIKKIKDLSRDEFRNRILASTYLFQESQLPNTEEQRKLFDSLIEEDVINNSVGEWIQFLRNNEDLRAPF